jgi:hypothetical protein
MSPKRVLGSSIRNPLTNQIFYYGGLTPNTSLVNTTSYPVFNPNTFNISYTDCAVGQSGYTFSQMWSYTNDVATWRNQSIVAQTNVGVDSTQFVPPVANGYYLFVGQSAYVFGGIILQCPFVNNVYNTEVTRVNFVNWKRGTDFIF